MAVAFVLFLMCCFSLITWIWFCLFLTQITFIEVNGLTECLESTVLTDQADQTTEIIPEPKVFVLFLLLNLFFSFPFPFRFFHLETIALTTFPPPFELYIFFHPAN